MAAAGVLAAGFFAEVAFAKSATVGDFLVAIARAKSLSVADSASARASLMASGVVLPPLALDKGLTEGDVVSIGGAVGVPVTTQNPSATFDTANIDSFISTFGKKLASSGGDTQSPLGFPNPGTEKGRGKKKGHHKSPADPI
ncbi:MAG TPA: hypothetical protein VFV75_20565 [Candidatus Polarisedimenticolaceae bacterium]|nr:hypothetical protein [Candidatus Polarisedimenticolaceae bacterium]